MEGEYSVKYFIVICTMFLLWDAIDEEPMTMLVVTQKIHTAKTADRILLINEGKLHGFGTHEELVKTNTLYQQIVDSQQEVQAR